MTVALHGLRRWGVLSLLLLAACASKPVVPAKRLPVIPTATNLTLVCTGSVSSEGYPFGKRPARQAAVRIAMNSDPTLTGAVFHADMFVTVNGTPQHVKPLAPPPICKPAHYSNDTCKAHQDDNSLSVSSFSSGVVTDLTLDKQTGVVRYGSGGIDGGWDFQGTCKPE
jgi:hypothetical protein